MRFRDRAEAGQRLARALADLDLESPVVLALPRGGVPVGLEVARLLQAPLDVLVARKIGAPGQPELGIGAIAEGGGIVMDGEAVRALGVSDALFDRLAEAARDELDRRVQRYRGGRPLPTLEGRDVVLVDDGLATGVTAEAALHALRGRRPHRVVLSVPVGAPETVARLRDLAVEVVCIEEPSPFGSVGRFYERFDQTSDDEVMGLLAESADWSEAAP